MSGKKKGGKGKEGGGGAGLQDNQVLQAILMADSFKRTFVPVAFETPNVLLPLVNVPMLEYTLEFLSQNGVEEVFIFCVWHAKMIREYLATSKWMTIMTVRCVTSTACMSPGDALRELDTMGVVRSDPFILISGDVVSNMNLKRAIEFHKEVRKRDNQAVMTVVMKDVQKGAGIKPIVDDLIVAFDSQSKQLLLFDDDMKSPMVELPAEIVKDHPSIDFMTNVLDCHVDICSPELLMQFSDNFDYQDVRRHFIENEVLNWELGMHIYSYFIEKEYAARVHDPRTYHSVCGDIIRRWTYPMVPDAQLLLDTSYVHHGGYVYKEHGVQIAPTAKIGTGVVVGANTIIEDGCDIRNCVIGRNCFIHKGAVLENSHFWGENVVEEGASVRYSIVCNGAKIREKANLSRGCILSFNTTVGKHVVLDEYTRVTNLDSDPTVDGYDDDDDEDYDDNGKVIQDNQPPLSPASSSGRFPRDAKLLGEDGNGVAWPAFVTDYVQLYNGEGEEDLERLAGKVDVMKASSLGCVEEEAWKDAFWQKGGDAWTEEGIGDCAGDNGLAGAPEVASDPYEVFLNSVSEVVLSGHQEAVSSANVLMEIKSLKFAHNKEFDDCLKGSVPAILQICGLGSDVQAVQLIKRIKEIFAEGAWGHDIVTSLIQNEDNQACVISKLETLALKEGNEAFKKVFHLTLEALYDADAVSDTSILAWADKCATRGRENNLIYEAPVQQLLEWLRSEDDSDESDEDDDDED